MTRHYEVYDEEGNVIEQGERPEDPTKVRIKQYVADLTDLARDVKANPGNYNPAQIAVAKLFAIVMQTREEDL